MSPARETSITITLDGRTVRAAAGAHALDVARAAGVEIPTLCHHPDLEPVGACRLCMVEVTHPDWRGWSGLMAACLYPVSDGMQISTRSERVLEARRRLLALLAARCPSSDVIQELARAHGASTDRLASDADADSCILCGLCTRACETYATSAITTHGRGTDKAVGTFFGAAPEDCVGCGACAMICPTGHIEAQREQRAYHIWGREFPLASCRVVHNMCVGCGACEEACPFDVPRVMVIRGGARVAAIPEQHCRGCGACVGACPSGAVKSREAVGQQPAGAATVIACTRSGLSPKQLPEGVELIAFDCTGRVTPAMILDRLARGSSGVLVLGRHQEICRHRGAEDPARARVERTALLAELMGLRGERVRFEIPAPGASGPGEAVARFAADMAELPALAAHDDAGTQDEGLDSALTLAARVDAREARRPDGPVLLAGALPCLELLGGDLFRPVELAGVLATASSVLGRLTGAEVSPYFGRSGDTAAQQIETLTGAGRVFSMDPEEAGTLREAGLNVTLVDDLLQAEAESVGGAGCKVACLGSAGGELLEALGHEPVDLGADPLPDEFSMSPRHRMMAELLLQRAEAQGAERLLVPSPAALARWAIICRHGTWRASAVTPVLGVQLAAAATCEMTR